jgi:rSAM/selenodomain-associated transferase 2
MLSVVIPTLNAAHGLGRTIDCLQGRVGEIIVADGGSDDGTVAVAEARGGRIVRSTAGRGTQLAAGAAAASRGDPGGDWLLFLHGDTWLGPGWVDAAQGFMATTSGDHRAAVFRYVLDDDAPAARRLEAVVRWRWRWLGLPYGDQGLLISRDFYHALGGFDPMPLMEDVDFVRRIGRHRLVILEADAVTSAVRYRRGGYWRRPARNALCLCLYFLGLPPRRLVRLYG